NKISKSLENGEIYDIILYGRSHRILAKYGNQKELRYSRFHYETSNNEGNHRLVNKRDNNTYEQLKRAKPNNMEAYLNSFKYRHSKKKGLKKLDCYYEKKLFSSLDKIEKLAKHKNFNHRQIKKMLFKKYGFALIILCLMPLFGLILPIMYYKDTHIRHRCFKIEQEITFNLKNFGEKKEKYKAYLHRTCEFLPDTYVYLNYLFIFSVIILIVLLIIYAIIKIGKYKRIKAG
ncbi:Plasmodium exported protein, unknown function, partial [Plasmodium vivax]